MTARGFDALLPSLECRAATVERSLGGAVTAIFGVPTVHEDDALRAVSAAAEMREGLAALQEELVAEWGAALDVRIGVGTGEVLAGRDGDAPYATGAPVAEALRLQHAAAAGAILLDELTHRLVRDVVSTELQGDHVRLLGMRSTVGQVRRFDSPMVGRARERRRLDDAFQQARATARASSSRFSVPQASGSRVLWRSSCGPGRVRPHRAWALSAVRRGNHVLAAARGDPRRSGHRRRDLRRGEPATTRRRARRRGGSRGHRPSSWRGGRPR